MGDALSYLSRPEVAQGLGHFGNAATGFSNAFSPMGMQRPMPYNPTNMLQQDILRQQAAKLKRDAQLDEQWLGMFKTTPPNMQVASMGYDVPAPATENPMMARMDPMQRAMLAGMGREQGAPALFSLANKDQWSPATVGGMPGQQSRLTGEFKPFSPNTIGRWEPEDRSGVPGQRNSVTNEWKPLDPSLSKVQVNPNINMPPQESEEKKIVGKAFGEQYVDIQKAGFNAHAANAKLDVLGQALDRTYTGTGAETVQGLKKAAKAVGMDVEGYGEAELATAVSREMALQLRNPAGGAGMPGAMSDPDREFLVSMTPGLSTTPEGRKLMIEYQKRVNSRNIEVAKIARDYRKTHGALDEGFYDKLAEYSAKNPLFKQEDFDKASKVAPAPVTTVTPADAAAELARRRKAAGGK